MYSFVLNESWGKIFFSANLKRKKEKMKITRLKNFISSGLKGSIHHGQSKLSCDEWRRSICEIFQPFSTHLENKLFKFIIFCLNMCSCHHWSAWRSSLCFWRGRWYVKLYDRKMFEHDSNDSITIVALWSLKNWYHKAIAIQTKTISDNCDIVWLWNVNANVSHNFIARRLLSHIKNT